MSCPRHQGGRWKPQHGSCLDCRRAELDILKRMQRSERERLLDGPASPAFKAWTPANWENYQSPDRIHPERKRLPHGKEENHRAR